jgi:hypothetical protein
MKTSKDLVEWDSLHISVHGPTPSKVRGGVEGYIALDSAIDDLIAEIEKDAKAKLEELIKANPAMVDFKLSFS